MKAIIIYVVVFCVTRLVIMVLEQRVKIKELEHQIDFMEQSKERWENLYWNFASPISNDISLKQDIIKAVKYAMKQSHPDNGGNAEDFIRFQKCYEELTRK